MNKEHFLRNNENGSVMVATIMILEEKICSDERDYWTWHDLATLQLIQSIEGASDAISLAKQYLRHTYDTPLMRNKKPNPLYIKTQSEMNQLLDPSWRRSRSTGRFINSDAVSERLATSFTRYIHDSTVR